MIPEILPKRKNIRLKNYNYKKDGYYFVTIVTRERLPLLGNFKEKIKESINDLPRFISGLSVDYFIVMDDHIHIIFVFDSCIKSLGEIVRAMKYNITEIVAAGLLSHKRLSHSNATATDKTIWQRNYYEHIIRNEKALLKIREYIRNNPLVEKVDFKKFYLNGLDKFPTLKMRRE